MKLDNNIIFGIVGIFGISVAGMVALLVLAPDIAVTAVPLLISSILVPLFGVFAAKITSISSDVQAVTKKIDIAAENIQLIEQATNSMKDALVASTGNAKLAEGLATGQAAGEAKGRADQAAAQAGEALV